MFQNEEYKQQQQTKYNNDYDHDHDENTTDNDNDNENRNQTNSNEDVDEVDVDLEDTFSIYRFKFREGFMAELHNFSKIHQYDNRKDFKEAWEVWIKDNEGIVEEETSRLTLLGYDGKIVEKMFKSARYYFRKKSNVAIDAKQRTKYITISKILLQKMDAHIELQSAREDYSPKSGLVQFCLENETLVKDCLKTILEQGITNKTYILDKIKKTYKNRYFIYTNRVCV